MGGRLRHGGEDHLHHPFDILQNLVVPEPQDRPSLRRKVATARFVGVNLNRVMPPIQFDADPNAPARKIDDKVTNHQLPRKPRSMRA